jgi:pimeloyl-ACP methyl ester carboxylesterase
MHTKIAYLSALLLSITCGVPAVAVETKQITVNGTPLTYVEEGKGVPVVLVHGAVGDYRTWTGEMADFASRYHVIAYSLRSHYPNTWTDGPYSAQVHIADLVALLQALNLGPVHLVGHSYGGLMAAVVAREHPELVRSLVLAEPSLNGLIAANEDAKPQLAQVGAVMKTAQGLVQKGESEQAVVAFIDFVNEPGGGFKGIPEFYRNGMLQNASTVKPLLASPPAPSFTCDDAKASTAPTLLVEGQLTHNFRRLLIAELQPLPTKCGTHCGAWGCTSLGDDKAARIQCGCAAIPRRALAKPRGQTEGSAHLQM